MTRGQRIAVARGLAFGVFQSLALGVVAAAPAQGGVPPIVWVLAGAAWMLVAVGAVWVCLGDWTGRSYVPCEHCGERIGVNADWCFKCLGRVH
jgi:hypothetical protein